MFAFIAFVTTAFAFSSLVEDFGFSRNVDLPIILPSFDEELVKGNYPPEFDDTAVKFVQTYPPYIQTGCSSTYLDAPSVFYDHQGFLNAEVSCSEAFVQHQAVWQGDECFLAVPINAAGETLKDVCGQTFCSFCEAEPADGSSALEGSSAPSVKVEMFDSLEPKDASYLSTAKVSELNVYDADEFEGLAAPAFDEVDGIAAPLPSSGMPAPKFDASSKRQAPAKGTRRSRFEL